MSYCAQIEICNIFTRHVFAVADACAIGARRPQE